MVATQTRAPAAAGVKRRLFSRKEYHAMAKAGILADDERVELFEGEIVVMSPIGTRHSSCVDRLGTVFHIGNSLTGRAIVRVQNPVVTAGSSELQPDAMLIVYRDDYYDLANPRPNDVMLLIEVSDSSVRYDRRTKAPHYARVGIRELWIVNLNTDEVEVYTEPSPNGYTMIRRFESGDTIAPSAMPDLKIEVSSIMPRRPGAASQASDTP